MDSPQPLVRQRVRRVIVYILCFLVFLILVKMLIAKPKESKKAFKAPAPIVEPVLLENEAVAFTCGVYSRKLGSGKKYVQFGILERLTSMPVIRETSRRPLVGEQVKVEWHSNPTKVWVSIDFDECPPL
ncbi:MAG: hypothetical protein AAB458_02470 [Patescibacteria group bacterium]